MHKNGNRYEWESGFDPDKIRKAPEWLIELLEEKNIIRQPEREGLNGYGLYSQKITPELEDGGFRDPRRLIIMNNNLFERSRIDSAPIIAYLNRRVNYERPRNTYSNTDRDLGLSIEANTR